MVAIKPAPSRQEIAAKIAKKVGVAEEARRAEESIVAAEASMHRHSVGDKVGRRAHPRPPTCADWLAFQVVVYYPKGELWEGRSYHGVVAMVGAAVLREWDGDDFIQVRLGVGYGDGSKGVRCCNQSTHTAHSPFAHTQCTPSICHTQCTHTTHT